MMTARPAAILGPPARVRCRSPRGVALRVVPLVPDFEPTAADTRAARRLRSTLADAYADGGREALVWTLREAIHAAVRGRAEYAEERAVLRAWQRYTLDEVTPAWLATAYGRRMADPLTRTPALG